MSMKVCKLVRLTQKDDKGKFVKGEKAAQVVVRSKCVVSDEAVAESESTFATKGLLYVVDEKKTAARDKIVDAEVDAAREGKTVEFVPTPVAEAEEEPEVDPKAAEDFKEDKKEDKEDKKDKL